MEKKCAFPNCNNLGDSKGKKFVDGVRAVKRFKWCRFHRKGAGKNDRLKLNKI